MNQNASELEINLSIKKHFFRVKDFLRIQNDYGLKILCRYYLQAKTTALAASAEHYSEYGKAESEDDEHEQDKQYCLPLAQ